MEIRTVLNRKLLGGLVLLALGGLGYTLLPKSPAGSADESSDSVALPVSERYIPAFSIIKPEWISMKQYPRAYVPPGALHSKDDLSNAEGRPIFMSTVEIPEGQPLTRTILAETSKSHGLSSILRPGKVAVSFATDKAHAAGGWPQPGDIVALFAMTASNKNVPEQTAKLLLPNVQILAIDNQRLGQPAPEAKPDAVDAIEEQEKDSEVITVLLSPAQAEMVIDARERGLLTMVLRAMGDDLTWSDKS